MLAPLVLLFIVVPIVEIYVIIKVGELIGPLWTVLLLIADSVLGSLLMRSQGRAVWRRFQAALSEGRPPAREVLDGVLVIFGGALLVTPGFASDVLGLALLLPPTRAAVRGALARRFAARMLIGTAARMGRRRRGAVDDTQPPAGRIYDVDGSAVDVDRERGRLP